MRAGRVVVYSVAVIVALNPAIVRAKESVESSLDGSARHVPGKLLFQIRRGYSPEDVRRETHMQSVTRLLGEFRFTDDQSALITAEGLDRWYIASVGYSTDMNEVRSAVSLNTKVERAELDYYFQPAAVPTDPNFGNQWGLENTGQAVNGVAGTRGADIDAPEAWGKITSSTVTVGVLDSGIDYTHPDLCTDINDPSINCNIWTNPGETGFDANGQDKRTNGIDDESDGFIDDWKGWDFGNGDNDPQDDLPTARGHGTHIAGIIGALGSNSRGVAGVAWKIKLAPIKIFSLASGAGAVASSDAIVRGLTYAFVHRFKITNNSYSCVCWQMTRTRACIGAAGCAQVPPEQIHDDPVYSAIKVNKDVGGLFVTAAGDGVSGTGGSSANTGELVGGNNNDSMPVFPCSFNLDNILCVTASDSSDLLPAYANYGRISVDVAAPGDNIYSTLPNNGYGFLSGTSMAAASVTGAAALALGYDISGWNSQCHDDQLCLLIQRIKLNGDAATALTGKIGSGRRLNLNNILF